MSRSRVLAIVQAGGAGSRMDVLTRETAKPALPFAGVFQLIDLPLSNLAHSGIDDVWLSVSYLGSSLEEQVSNGRPWDLDRTAGGLRLLMPQEGSGSTDEEGFAKGNADELYRLRDQVRAADPELVVVLSADHVYRFDFAEALATHRERGADCTVVTTRVPLEDASDHAIVEVAGDGGVTGFWYKPEDPPGPTIATEIFVYDPAVLVATLEELHRERAADPESAAEPGDSGLGDFGDHLLPRLVERGNVVAHPLPGYWRDLGQPHKYVAAHRDVLLDDVGVLGHPGWPILTRQPQRTPARLLDGSAVIDSLVSPGCTVGGQVERSVLGPGVVVEAGAVVRDSVVFADTTVRAGATVDWAVLDQGCVVEADAVVGAAAAEVADDDGLVLAGRGSRIAAGVRVPAGARLEPGSSA
jgi:glucose-1-phosphate adenylyltransferase